MVSGKPPPGKLTSGKFPPIKFPSGEFAQNIPTHVFKLFVFSSLSPLSFIFRKRLFCISFCLLLRLKSRSAKGASNHPAFMGNCRTISHTFHSPFYPVDKGKEDVGWFLEWTRGRIFVEPINI